MCDVVEADLFNARSKVNSFSLRPVIWLDDEVLWGFGSWWVGGEARQNLHLPFSILLCIPLRVIVFGILALLRVNFRFGKLTNLFFCRIKDVLELR
jgi:hypothetical protein